MTYRMLIVFGASLLVSGVSRADDIARKPAAELKRTWKESVPQLIEAMNDGSRPVNERTALAQTAAEVVRESPNRNQPVIRDLDRLVRSSDPTTQRGALTVLGEMRGPEAETAILTVARDRKNSQELRATAIAHFVKSAKEEAAGGDARIRQTLQPLLTDAQPLVALRAARGLALAGDRAGENAAISVLKAANPQSPANRPAIQEAMRTLAAVGDPANNAYLAPFETSQSPALRLQAVIARQEIAFRNAGPGGIDLLRRTVLSGKSGAEVDWSLNALMTIAAGLQPGDADGAILALREIAGSQAGIWAVRARTFMDERCKQTNDKRFCL